MSDTRRTLTEQMSDLREPITTTLITEFGNVTFAIPPRPNDALALRLDMVFGESIFGDRMPSDVIAFWDIPVSVPVGAEVSDGGSTS